MGLSPAQQKPWAEVAGVGSHGMLELAMGFAEQWWAPLHAGIVQVSGGAWYEAEQYLGDVLSLNWRWWIHTGR